MPAKPIYTFEDVLQHPFGPWIPYPGMLLSDLGGGASVTAMQILDLKNSIFFCFVFLLLFWFMRHSRCCSGVTIGSTHKDSLLAGSGILGVKPGSATYKVNASPID